MSYTTALGITPDRAPIELQEFRNSHGWAPNIWSRLLGDYWFKDDSGLNRLWQDIEKLPDWQQVPLLLTFDTGVIPFQAFDWAAEKLIEFEARLPSNPEYVNHVPAIAELLGSKPEAPLFGVYGTSTSKNPFDPWDDDKDEPGSGIPLSEMYVLERHREFLPNRSEDND